jgi:ParB-like chromosome segregation protein Spo0J
MSVTGGQTHRNRPSADSIDFELKAETPPSLKNMHPDSALPSLKIHPAARELAKWLTALSGKEAADLKADIQANGIKVPILVSQDQTTIIDGRNRWMIAHDLKFKVKDVPIEVYDGKEEDISNVILSRNVFRRHLTDDQRTAAIAKVFGPKLEKEAQERMKAGKAAEVISNSTEGQVISNSTEVRLYRIQRRVLLARSLNKSQT